MAGCSFWSCLWEWGGTKRVLLWGSVCIVIELHGAGWFWNKLSCCCRRQNASKGNFRAAAAAETSHEELGVCDRAHPGLHHPVGGCPPGTEWRWVGGDGTHQSLLSFHSFPPDPTCLSDSSCQPTTKHVLQGLAQGLVSSRVPLNTCWFGSSFLVSSEYSQLLINGGRISGQMRGRSLDLSVADTLYPSPLSHSFPSRVVCASSFLSIQTIPSSDSQKSSCKAIIDLYPVGFRDDPKYHSFLPPTSIFNESNSVSALYLWEH